MISINRRAVLQLLGSSLSAAAISQPIRPVVTPAPAGADTCTIKTIPVPLDHSNRAGPTVELSYIQVGPFNRSLPTVFMLGDGQQFYIRQDTLGRFRSVFGPEANVIGIAGRGTSESLLAHLGRPESVDWAEAYQLLRYEQWTADADLLREHLLGKNGKVLIYGESGGGRLAHEYMIMHGGNAHGVCTESAVFEPIEGQIGVQADEFWRQLRDDERRDLSQALAERPGQRDFYAQLLQRQNYFVDLKNLAAERHQLIQAIAADQQTALQAYANKYQVSALAELMAAPQGFAIRVREYEIIHPLQQGPIDGADFAPDHVVSAMWARPLLDLNRAGKIPAPVDEVARLNACTADALVIAGRYDHVADYRVSIALAAHYPNDRLLLMNDDHQMHNLTADKKQLRNQLIQGWTKGFASPEFKSAWAAAEPLRWHETASD